MTPLYSKSTQSHLFRADCCELYLLSPSVSQWRQIFTLQTAMGIADFKAARSTRRPQAGGRGRGAAAGPSRSRVTWPPPRWALRERCVAALTSSVTLLRPPVLLILAQAVPGPGAACSSAFRSAAVCGYGNGSRRKRCGLKPGSTLVSSQGHRSGVSSLRSHGKLMGRAAKGEERLGRLRMKQE